MSEPTYDTIQDALRAIVEHLGGAKKVGPQMRGSDIGVKAAESWCLSCLNPDRRERFAPEHVEHLLREGCRAGFHLGKHWLDDASGYERSRPLNPEDEKVRIAREVVQAVSDLGKLVERLERLGIEPGSLRAVK